MTRLAPTFLCLVLLLASGCASLEERLCNQTTAFQKGYDDVINGRQGSPGLAEGQSCKDSKNYSYADFHRDYMAGFEKAKVAHCTATSATNIGKSDAAAGKELKASYNKLAICEADEKIKVNFETYYTTGYRKEFCQAERIQSMASKDAKDLGDATKTPEDFELCAFQKASLYKTYKDTYLAEIRKQCSSAKAASLGVTHARAKKNLSVGLSLLEKCPSDLENSATQTYTSAFQSERANMMEEERLKLEKSRLAQEERSRRELIDLQRKQLKLEREKYKNPIPKY